MFIRRISTTPTTNTSRLKLIRSLLGTTTKLIVVLVTKRQHDNKRKGERSHFCAKWPLLELPNLETFGQQFKQEA